MNIRILAEQRRRGDISTGHLALLIVVLFVIVLALVGYMFYTAYSEKARAEGAQQKALLAQQQAEADRQLAEQAAEKDEARSKREAFAIRAQSVTNLLSALIEDIPALQSRLASLRSGEEGKAVALHPDLVVAARSFFRTEAAELPTREESIQKLEAVRRSLYELVGKTDSTFAPTPDMLASLDANESWADTSTRRVNNAKGIVDSLLREAEIKIPPAPLTSQSPTLQTTIDALTTREWDERQRIETAKVLEAEKLATATVADAKTNQIINQAQIDAERLMQAEAAKKASHEIEIQKQQNAVEAEKLRAKARSPEVQQALITFFTPGHFRPDHKFSVDLVPMSYSDLVKAGALERTLKGLKKLQTIATNPNDKIRPRMNKTRLMLNNDGMEQFSEVQTLLIELGPTLVELGMLAP